MKRGLVIGKFMPLHQGHIALVNFASNYCDELIVSMSYTDRDSIPSEIRFMWLQLTFAENPKIKLAQSVDDFDDDQLPLTERTKIWATFIKSRFPKIDVVVSSEFYGQPFANHLGAESVLFNQKRDKFPVSATQIRNQPKAFWDFIPEVVRPYYLNKN